MMKLSIVVVGVLLIGCTSTPQRLDPNYFYKRDLPFCVIKNTALTAAAKPEQTCYEGVSVIPRQSYYDFELEPKGEAVIDLMLVTTCHREDSFEKSSTNWIKKITGGGEKFAYHFAPVTGVEDDGDCDLRFNTYEKEKGRHSWSLVRFEHPKYDLEATLYCNGKVITYRGVSICQSKAGLVERVKFTEPVMVEVRSGCNKFKKVGDLYEYEMSLNECLYTVITEGGRKHSMITVGYENVLVREQ